MLRILGYYIAQCKGNASLFLKPIKSLLLLNPVFFLSFYLGTEVKWVSLEFQVGSNQSGGNRANARHKLRNLLSTLEWKLNYGLHTVSDKTHLRDYSEASQSFNRF